MCFNEDCRYQFTPASNFCLLELFYVAFGHLDELQRNIQLGVCYRQISLYSTYSTEIFLFFMAYIAFYEHVSAFAVIKAPFILPGVAVEWANICRVLAIKFT